MSILTRTRAMRNEDKREAHIVARQTLLQPFSTTRFQAIATKLRFCDAEDLRENAPDAWMLASTCRASTFRARSCQ